MRKLPNNALERTVKHGGPRLTAALDGDLDAACP